MPRKRVAVNALTIARDYSGGRTYLLNLLRELIDIGRDEFEFEILCSSVAAPAINQQLKGENVHIHTFSPLFTHPVARIAVEQLFLPVWLRSNKVDLLFAARNIMPLLTKCPTVIGVLSMHLNYDNKRLPTWRRVVGNRLLKASARRANAFVAISEYAGQTYLEKFSVSRESLFVSPLGVRLLDVTGREPITQPVVGSGYILFVSTLHPHKNVSFLLRVVAETVRLRPTTKLVIVGRAPGESLAYLQTLVRQLSLVDHVHFLGSVPEEELMKLYAHAGVFVFPSLIEGFGLSVLEAMAHGVPVVSSNCTSLPEVVGEAGVILEPVDEKEWARRIVQILQDTALREELVQKATRRAREFTWRRTAEITLDSIRFALEHSA